MSKFEWIKLGTKQYKTEIMKSRKDIQQGMKKYNIAPLHPMLFILKNDNGSVTMKNVKFPLDVVFFDKQFNPVNIINSKYSIRLYPDQDDTIIPKNTYYMMEFPVGMILPK